MLKIIGMMLAVVFATAGLACANPLQEGGDFPDVQLNLSGDRAVARYLEVPPADSVPLSEVGARGIIINIYSLYCPPCHREAPLLNNLYRMIKEMGLEDDLKLIGIAVGNNEQEVSAYRERHKVPFPLLMDPDYTIHKQVGSVPVPSFYAVLLQCDGGPQVVLSKIGEVEDEKKFLEDVLRAMSKGKPLQEGLRECRFAPGAGRVALTR
ncbi:MAG: peroxiredoxin family protein [Desulfovibrionales bacterium]